jgi:hypothetical protein
VRALWIGCHLKASFCKPTYLTKGFSMKLKTYNPIQIFMVVSSSVLLMACNSKTTAPLSLLFSSASSNSSETHRVNDKPNLVDNYGVTPAHNVIFSKIADEQTKDFSY